MTPERDGPDDRASAPAARQAVASGENPPVRRLADWPADRLRGLADEHGTPLYVYDLERVRQNCRRLRAAFPGVGIDYAVKANATRAVLATIAAEGFGAECASAGEVVRAVDAGFERVRYTAVNPPARDLDRVRALCDRSGTNRPIEITITAGAADTLDRLAERGFEGPLYVRINPEVGAGHHAKVATGADPKFGVPLDRVDEVLDRAAREFDLVGLHAHAGSGILDEFDAHRELVGRLGAVASRHADAIERVSVGGGFGVPYRPGDGPLDLEGVARATREALGELDARVEIEPGRYVVADAGVLLTTVNTVKPTPETTVVGVDAGMHCLIRPALYDAYHAIGALAPDAADRERVSSTVVGPICESSDVLGRDRELPAPARGDRLAVANAGAYGYEMASTYNSRPRPPVVAIDGDEAFVAARRETIAALTRLERKRTRGRRADRDRDRRHDRERTERSRAAGSPARNGGEPR